MPNLRSAIASGIIAAAAAVKAQNSTVVCAEGLKMFVSRGTSETMGYGITESLVDTIADRIEASNAEAILYPASVADPNYFTSVGLGTIMVKEKMTAYARECPDSKMAWFGYSQGAQITTNNLCGMPPIWGMFAGYDVQTELDKIIALQHPLPEEITKNVVSVVLFGDPTQTGTASYNRGTWNNTGNGMFYREDITACEALGKRIRAYCDAGDPFCDVGELVDQMAHLEYVQRYSEEIVEFVVEQYRNGGESGNSTSGTENPASTPAPESGVAGPLAPVTGVIAAASLLTYFLI